MELLLRVFEAYPVLIFAIILASITVVPYILYEKRKSNKVQAAIDKAKRLGLWEPVTIHPKVNRDICIGSGACVSACPEGKILGLVDNKSMTVCASECVGHGACARACPVGAIELVFGTERRGVDIPQVHPNFETNVKRLYIAGELGGMGLIRNSVTQGKEAVGYIKAALKETPYRTQGVIDILIVGAGPAGLSATLMAQKEGLNYITIEREEDVGGAILSYPRSKVVMTSPADLPLYGKVMKKEISKEELISLWGDISAKTGIKISTREAMISSEPKGDYFEVKTSGRTILTRYLLLSIGRRGAPRKLDVPGEKSPKVMYRLLEPERYANMRLLVVGGGDSALESAMALASQAGTQVTLSYRGDSFSRAKAPNRARLDAMVAEGKINVLYQSNVLKFQGDKVDISRGERIIQQEFDFAFVLAGGVAPNDFLKKAGVVVETKYGTR
ncbi:MAG: NAD(P)-binding domain-containing protein [Nitrospinota bacterium]|nr:NAD(P)-binding domain-containing protein [Nitrospinota bacterium]